MEYYGSKQVASIFERLGIPEESSIQNKTTSKAIYNAQKTLEGNNYGTRKAVLDFDNIISEQMFLFYSERNKILSLSPSSLHSLYLSQIEKVVERKGEKEGILPPSIFLSLSEKERKEKGKVKEKTKEYFEKKREEVGESIMFSAERMVLLSEIDRAWQRHLDDVAALKEGISFSSFSHKDPATEYKSASYLLYNRMIERIWEEAIRRTIRVKREEKKKNFEIAL